MEIPAVIQPFLAPDALKALAAFAVLAVPAFFVDRWFERSAFYVRSEKAIKPIRDAVAPTVSVTVGLLLIFSALGGNLLSQSVPLAEYGVFGLILRGLEGLIGLLLLLGLFTHAAAAGLIALLLSAFLLRRLAALPQLYLGGLAVFLFFFSRGRFSLDWFLGKPILSTPRQRKLAYLAMRIIVGLTLISLSFRFWPGNAVLGPQSAIVMALLLIAGVCLTTGFVTRISAVVLVPVCIVGLMNGAQTEWLGLLPILGALFAFYVFGDTYHKKTAVSAIGPPSASRTSS